MSFMNFEFPNTNFYDSDLRELIAMYKKVKEDYNELVETVDKLESQWTNIDSTVQALIDKTVVQLRTEVAELKADVKALEDSVNATVSDLKSYVDSEVSEAEKYVNSQVALIKSEMSVEIQMLKNNIELLDKEIDSKLSGLEEVYDKKLKDMEDFVYNFTVEQVSVINPYTGERQTIQECLNSLFKLMQLWSLTAYEYDRMELTAQEYEDYAITAFNYDWLGKWYLLEKGDYDRKCERRYDELEKRLYMYNPVTGEVNEYRQVVELLFAMVRVNSITATEYDMLMLTADAYDAKGVTAYEYDWQARNIFVNGQAVGFTGLSVNDFGRLGVNSLNYVVYN